MLCSFYKANLYIVMRIVYCRNMYRGIFLSHHPALAWIKELTFFPENSDYVRERHGKCEDEQKVGAECVCVCFSHLKRGSGGGRVAAGS